MATSVEDRAAEHRYRWVLLLITGLVCVVAIGTPLIGHRQLFAGDLVLNAPPWSEEFIADRENVSPQSDFVDVTLGEMRVGQRRLARGDFPEWDTHVATGRPAFVEPSSGAFSPIALPTIGLPVTLAPAYVKLFEVLASIGGMYLLSRRLGFTAAPGLIGGVVYAFSGFQVMFSSWGQPLTGAMIPWLFWAAERLVQRRRVADVAPLAVVFASMLIAGFPAVALYAVVSLSGYLAMRAAVSGVSRWFADRPPSFAVAARGWARRQCQSVGLLAVGLGLGAGLVAILLVPFYEIVSEDALGSRGSRGVAPVPFKAIATLIYPHAFGVLNQTPWFGPLNEIEAVGFVGTTAFVLSVFAVVSVGRRTERLRVVLPMAALLLFTCYAVYLGGKPLALLNLLPGFSENPVGRMRAVIGFFVAVLAAAGAQRLSESPATRWVGARAVTAVGVLGVGWLSYRMVREFATSNDAQDTIRPWMLLAVGFGLIAVAVVLVGRSMMSGRAVGVVLLLLVGAEALSFVGPYFPRVPPEHSMPVTDSHRFLQRTQTEQGRLIAHGWTLLPGTTRYYGLDSVSGHAFHNAEIQALYRRFDPTSFSLSPTYSIMNVAPFDQITSPILDRLAADQAVLPLGTAVFGSRDPVTHVLTSGNRHAAVVSGGEVRGVELELRDEVAFEPGQERELVVELVEAGETVARVEQRFSDRIPAGVLELPLAGEALGATPRQLRVRLEGLDGATTDLTTELSARMIRRADDGLALEFVGGVAIWRRLTAMPRFRWAADAVVAEDLAAQADLVASGMLSPNTVVLERPTSLRGGPGEVTSIDRDDPDRFDVSVSSAEGGWLVVADAMRDGWSATIDGETTAVLDADVAFAAVAVPAGEHTVRFDYQAPGTATGRAASLASAVALIALAGWGHRRHRRSGSVQFDAAPVSAAR